MRKTLLTAILLTALSMDPAFATTSESTEGAVCKMNVAKAKEQAPEATFTQYDGKLATQLMDAFRVEDEQRGDGVLIGIHPQDSNAIVALLKGDCLTSAAILPRALLEQILEALDGQKL